MNDIKLSEHQSGESSLGMYYGGMSSEFPDDQPKIRMAAPERAYEQNRSVGH